MKRTLFASFVLAVFVAVLGLFSPAGVEAQRTVKNYFSGCSGTNCDNVLTLGGTWKIGATAVTATAAQLNGASATSVAGVAAGYKIARGSVVLDGTNPSSVASGLTSILHCFVENKRTTAPADEVTAFTWGNTTTTLDVYAWTTNGTDPTLVASTDADDVISWICIGT